MRDLFTISKVQLPISVTPPAPSVTARAQSPIRCVRIANKLPRPKEAVAKEARSLSSHQVKNRISLIFLGPCGHDDEKRLKMDASFVVTSADGLWSVFCMNENVGLVFWVMVVHRDNLPAAVRSKATCRLLRSWVFEMPRSCRRAKRRADFPNQPTPIPVRKSRNNGRQTQIAGELPVE